MNIKLRSIILMIKVLILCSLFLTASLCFSQEGTKKSGNPLEPFSWLIGGKWYLGNSYTVFEWGVGQHSVLAKSYFMVNDEMKLVSEGSWFWHPAEKKIKGYFVAIDMPVNFFDYTTRFENGKMVSDLLSFTIQGEQQQYVETWEPVSKNKYLWKLLSDTDGELKEVMSGEYVRKQ